MIRIASYALYTHKFKGWTCGNFNLNYQLWLSISDLFLNFRIGCWSCWRCYRWRWALCWAYDQTLIQVIIIKCQTKGLGSCHCRYPGVHSDVQEEVSSGTQPSSSQEVEPDFLMTIFKLVVKIMFWNHLYTTMYKMFIT